VECSCLFSLNEENSDISFFCNAGFCWIWFRAALLRDETYCAVRGTFQSTLTPPESVTHGCNGCPHLMQKTTSQQKTHTIPPVNRLARFTIDQERHSPDLSPNCVPIMALVQNSQLSLVDPINDQEILPTRLMALPEPPLLILLQKQSFLI
jgi:hypothetical protein